MLQCTVGKDVQRLKDRDVQQRQKLEAANHRIMELENQLAKKEKLIMDQKKLLEDSKNQSRSDSRDNVDLLTRKGSSGPSPVQYRTDQTHRVHQTDVEPSPVLFVHKLLVFPGN